MKRLVMIGGGHAHLSVLEKLARQPIDGVERILITPNRYQNYSGMLPGWISGHYTREQSRIDLMPLVHAAGVNMINVSLLNMDADQRVLTLSDGSSLTYDFLSLDVGSETQTEGLEGLGERLLPVKPLDDFFEKWPEICQRAREKKEYALVVVGGGAAGVELALDQQGYILVDAHHRTQSHPEVFAAGDTCARTDVQMARSGVHAVKAGPVLAENLYAVLTEPANATEPLKSYHPRASSLYLLACGPRYAIASWGRWSFQGQWVWFLKNWIDLGFIRRFSLLSGGQSTQRMQQHSKKL